MLSFHVNFVQSDRRKSVKQYAPDLSIQAHENYDSKNITLEELEYLVKH